MALYAADLPLKPVSLMTLETTGGRRLAGEGSLAGLRDAAIVALMSDAMLRVSEVAALDCADLATETDGSGRLTIRYSKTDQKGEGAVQLIGAPTVRRVQVWLDAAGHRAGPMFRRVRRGAVVGTERIADRSLRRIIARRAADAGVGGRISGHSLRVGAAQSLAAAGGTGSRGPRAPIGVSGPLRNVRSGTGMGSPGG